MVVVVIIGILVAIAIPVYNNVQASAQSRAIEANLRIIDGAITQWQAENQGIDIPDSATGIVPASLVPNYLREWPAGPAGAMYGIASNRATTTVAP